MKRGNNISNEEKVKIFKDYLKDDHATLDENIEDILLNDSISSEIDSQLLKLWEDEANDGVIIDKQKQEEVLSKIKTGSSNIIPSSFSRKNYKLLFLRSLAVLFITGVIIGVVFYNNDKKGEPMLAISKDKPYDTVVPVVPINDAPTFKKEPPTLTVVKAITPKAAPLVEPDIISEPDTVAIKELKAVIVTPKVKNKVYNIPVGEKMEINLPDGSKVTAQGGSTLLHKEFNTNSRTIVLDGEAYFAVAKSSTPFIVESHGLKIRVTGTEFKVNNFSNNKKAVIKVTQGSVTAITSSGMQYCLIAGSEFTYDFERLDVAVSVKTGNVKVIAPSGECFYIEPDEKMEYDSKASTVSIEKVSKKNKKRRK